MKFIAALLSMLSPPADAAIVEHVNVKPAGNVAANKLARARRLAAKRHGKPFETQVDTPRKTAPSAVLKALNEMSTPKPVIVVPAARLVAKK